MMNINKLTIFIILCFSFFACNPDRVYHKTYTFSDYQWKESDKVIFEPEIKEENSGNSFKLVLNIRYIQGFPYKYLHLKLRITRPDGTEAEKEVSIRMINDDKSYIGEGIGDYWDIDYTDDEVIPFKGAGKYQIEIISAMEESPVYFINEIGVSLIKTTD